MQFIKDKGRRGKRLCQRFRWLLPACLLHALLVSGIFVALLMPYAIPAFAQQAQRMGHAAISGVTHTHEKMLPHCWDEGETQQNDVSDDCKQGADDSDESTAPAKAEKTADAEPSVPVACDSSDDNVFRSYAGYTSHDSCVTPAPQVKPGVPLPTEPAHPQATAPVAPKNPASAATPDLAIAKTTEAGDNYLTGQSVTFDLLVTNVSSVPVSGSISVVDTVPAGLTDLSADGGASWNVSMSAKTSPVEIHAVYKGSFPVEPGQRLPAIKVRGLLTGAALPGLTNVATVSSPDDNNPANNTARKAILVGSGSGSGNSSLPHRRDPHIPALPQTGSDPSPSQAASSR